MFSTVKTAVTIEDHPKEANPSMKETKLLPIYDPERDRPALLEAGRLLREGGLVAIPTETVYGLAANALDPEAVAGIFEAKGRPQDNPLIVHIHEMSMMEDLVTGIPEAAHRLAERFWPGPLTMILPKTNRIPMATSGGLETVAIRMPSNVVARAIIEAAGVPLAAPSANRSGSPSPTTWQHCVDDLEGRVDAIVQSDPCAVGVESTVITLCGEVPRLLRPGAVTLEQLRETLGQVEMDRGVLEQLSPDARVSSPGMKYKHYAPKAEVTLVRGTGEAFVRYVQQQQPCGLWAICFEEDAGLTVPNRCYGAREDHLTQANRIFDLLREMDKQGAKKVCIHCPDTDGVGLAVYNRLIRSAAFHVVDAT